MQAIRLPEVRHQSCTQSLAVRAQAEEQRRQVHQAGTAPSGRQACADQTPAWPKGGCRPPLLRCGTQSLPTGCSQNCQKEVCAAELLLKKAQGSQIIRRCLQANPCSAGTASKQSENQCRPACQGRIPSCAWRAVRPVSSVWPDEQQTPSEPHASKCCQQTAYQLMNSVAKQTKKNGEQSLPSQGDRGHWQNTPGVHDTVVCCADARRAC